MKIDYEETNRELVDVCRATGHNKGIDGDDLAQEVWLAWLECDRFRFKDRGDGPIPFMRRRMSWVAGDMVRSEARTESRRRDRQTCDRLDMGYSDGAEADALKAERVNLRRVVTDQAIDALMSQEPRVWLAVAAKSVGGSGALRVLAGNSSLHPSQVTRDAKKGLKLMREQVGWCSWSEVSV